MKALVVSRLTVLCTLVLVGCRKPPPGSGDTEGPIVFWTIDGQGAAGVSNATHAPVYGGKSYTVVARADDYSGIAETTDLRFSQDSGCTPVVDDGIASTTQALTVGPTWRSTAKADGTLPDQWSESLIVRPTFTNSCPEGEMPWMFDPILTLKIKDGVGNIRQATLTMELTSETGLSGSETFLEYTTESCSRDKVYYMSSSRPVKLLRGDEKTFRVSNHDIYWYCADTSDADYEVTRCPTGTNLVTVSRPSNDMKINCYIQN